MERGLRFLQCKCGCQVTMGLILPGLCLAETSTGIREDGPGHRQGNGDEIKSQCIRNK